jgi:hypothetical protein
VLFSGNKIGRCVGITEENWQDDQGLAPPEQTGSSCSPGEVGVGRDCKIGIALKIELDRFCWFH